MKALQITQLNKLEYDGRTTNLRPKEWAAVAALFDAGGSMPICEFVWRVWGHDVANRSIWAMVDRINEALAEIGYPSQCDADGDTIGLA